MVCTLNIELESITETTDKKTDVSWDIFKYDKSILVFGLWAGLGWTVKKMFLADYVQLLRPVF